MRSARKTLLAVAACAALIASATAAQPPVRWTANAPRSAESTGTIAAPDTTPAKPTAPKAAKGITTPTEITIEREIFSYDGNGRRDPYKSLMTSSDVRPLLSDLRLTAVAFDPDGNNSVAILRDSFSKQQYRIRVGQQLGRLRVAGIKQKSVQFTIEEFGFNRQETLTLSSDTTKVRNP